MTYRREISTHKNTVASILYLQQVFFIFKGAKMIKCHLSRILGERKQKIAEVSRETGINRNTLHRLYNETATRIELDVIETLCRYLEVTVGELFEIE